MNCQVPFSKRHKLTGEWQNFPCGKCYTCLRRRISGWSFRLLKEMQRSDSAFFLTLTYDTEYVPINENGRMTLDKTDVQKYIKRLRKLHEGNPIKYYFVGEYGKQKKRPHYHAIIFNAKAEHLEKAWQIKGKPLGLVHLGQVTEASIGYTLKYLCKQQNAYKNKAKEFSLMSKGLGTNYLTKQMINWHKDDLINRMYVPLMDGKKIAMPRYYKEKIYSELEREIISAYMQEVSQQHVENEVEKYGLEYEKRRIELYEQETRKFNKSRIIEKL